MNSGKYVFAQLLQFINSYEFEKCVIRYKGDHRVRELNCWNQFVQLFFDQLTARNSLRDICVCLKACSFFVTRAKATLDYVMLEQNYNLNESTGLRSDKTIKLWGHSENAVNLHVWIAICTYLIVAYVKYQLKSTLSIYEIMQILGISAFDKTPLKELLTETQFNQNVKEQNELFEF